MLTLVLVLPALAYVGAALVTRPQRGLLLLAALLPFDGLLLVIPGGDSFGPWKEALLAVTFAAALVSPRSARAQGKVDLPVWVPAAIAFVALGIVSAVLTGGTVAFWGLKISYLYALVPAILWRCPFTAADRDRLVGILMATGVVTALIGLAQQVVGPARLNGLGYEYNTAIRFSGSLLRSFSTFTQPFSFGLFLSLVLLVALPVALADAKRLRNVLFLVATPVLVAAMAASVVRGATLALLVGLLVLAVWRFRMIFHAFVPGLLVLLLIPTSVLTDYFSSSSLEQRTSGWATIFDSLLTAPLGNGIGTTGAAAEKAVEQGAAVSDVVTFRGTTDLYLPDNQFVKTVIELGPIGLWLFLVLGAAIVSASINVARRSTGRDRALAQGIAASIIGAAAASLVSTYLEIFPLDFYFWLLVGVLISLGGPGSTEDEGDEGVDDSADLLPAAPTDDDARTAVVSW